MENRKEPEILVGHNKLILRRMFSFMRVEDLKNCRLVSTEWFKNCQPYLKEKSVIELHFHLKEKKPKTPKKFLELFQTAPIDNTFSGVRIIFESKHTLFEWIGGKHPYPPLMDFLSTYGLQLNYFEMQILDGCYISYQSIALKKVLMDFMPNIEHLRVYTETREGGARLDVDTIPKICNTPDLSPNLNKLSKLKKLEWMVFAENWFVASDDEYSVDGQLKVLQKISTPAMTDVISCAPNLNSITTEGSLVTLDIFKTLSSENLSKLKEIFIDPRNSPHPLHLVLIQLTNLGNQNLKLESFAVSVLEDDGYQGDYCELLFLSLLQFIASQSDCLKKLQIRILPKRPTINTKNPLAFPKMAKLEQLYLSFENDRSIEVMFGGLTNWTDLFPNLKRLHIHYNHEHLKDNDITLPRLVSENTVAHYGVQVLKLFPNNFNDNIGVGKCIEVYGTVRQKFPNLQKLELYDKTNERMHSYNGNVQNSTSFVLKREPRVGWGQIVHYVSWPSASFV